MQWAIVAALAIGACGGGTPSGSSGDGGSGDGSGAGAAATQAGSSSTGDATLDALIKKRHAATFKVTYKWTTSSGSPPASETWYQKLPKVRIDFGEATDVTRTSQFVLANGFFVCETSATGSTCLRGTGAGEFPELMSFSGALMTSFESLLVSDNSVPVTRETRTIAGQQAACVKSGSLLALGLAAVQLCHASSGVPLFFEWKVGSDVLTMTAASYSANVPDSDFDLPATPP